MRKRILPLALIALEAIGLFGATRIWARHKEVQDLVQFWAAAKLITENPYSQQLVPQLEAPLGGVGLIMRNPPWALPFVLPLRWMSFPTAYAFWTVASFAVLVFCSRILWQFYSAQKSLLPISISLLFGPTLCLLLLGQTSILVLLGVTLFLAAVESRRDWVAGASLLLIMIKPHLALLFLVAAAAWAVQSKRYAIVAGGALAVMASSLAMIALNAHVFAQYLQFARVFGSEQVLYPNLGGLLALISGRRALAVAPSVAGLVWLILYFRRHQRDWDWKTAGPLLLLVSVTCSYYSYPYDEVLVLPALIAAAARGNRRAFLAGFFLTNAGYAFYLTNTAGKVGLDYMFLCWTASAWLLTYLASCAAARRALSASGGA